MAIEITQRELRDHSGKIIEDLNGGQSFVVTRNGKPVAELKPFERPFTTRDEFLAAFANASQIDTESFWADVDAFVDQNRVLRD
ncbi:MAG: type II toxin-antitoxin system Phd/YefM family antitoxin [Candidatus Dormibacteraceae bacterium]